MKTKQLTPRLQKALESLCLKNGETINFKEAIRRMEKSKIHGAFMALDSLRKRGHINQTKTFQISLP